MITVLGVHAGRVPPGTEAVLAEAATVAGGREVLDALAPSGARRVVLGADLDAALDGLGDGPACVLASGDPGFFGVLRRLRARLGDDALHVHPAPSSVAVAFARLGLPWDDALVLSAHGRDSAPAVAAALRHDKVAILTSPAFPPQELAARLAGSGRRMVVAERLGGPGERLTAGTPEELARDTFADPNVVLVLGDGAAGERAAVWPPRTPDGWALPEAAFEHRAGMITKREVRALVLAGLGPGTGDLVWDVGCGSGSVAIECARLGAAVVAVDHDAEAVALCARNAAAHAVPVRVAEGRAPQALHALPDPDAVFVGGGGENLDAILRVAAARARRAVVVTLAAVERATPAAGLLTAEGFEVEATLLQASRLRPLAGAHRLAAENPVFVVAGRRPS